MQTFFLPYLLCVLLLLLLGGGGGGGSFFVFFFLFVCVCFYFCSQFLFSLSPSAVFNESSLTVTIIFLLACLLVSLLARSLFCSLVCSFITFFVCLLIMVVGQLIGQSVDWLVGCLVGLSVEWLVGRFDVRFLFFFFWGGGGGGVFSLLKSADSLCLFCGDVASERKHVTVHSHPSLSTSTTLHHGAWSHLSIFHK